MDVNYTTDKSTQMLIYLLKAHGIRKVVASPGTTNAIFVASIQSDSYFEIYSSIDERSAAYIACGLAESSGEPVVITCTEATASRNYFPGLTEAYYRKLPILAITGFHDLSRVGNLYTQVIDRSIAPKDTVKLSVDIETCKSSKDEWFVNFKINKAILELTKNGGGPVYINLQISRWDFFAKELSVTRVIDRITHKDKFPIMPNGKIAIVIGSHKRFTEEETNAIERFCETRNGVVFCSLVSGYYGKYKINDSIVNFQKSYIPQSRRADLTIHLGEIGAANVSSKETWRVSEDGEVRDTFKNLRFIFQMDEFHFFSRYAEKDDNITTSYYQECIDELASFEPLMPDNIPFSNVWIASEMCKQMPSHSVLHLGILNSYRVWNLFKLPLDIETSCNFGGFGIDGGLSTLIGASFDKPNIIHFGVFGDLAFFYDINSLGNRHIKNNIRILLINNGKGNEFRNCIHPAYKLGRYADEYIAAAGHFANKSDKLVKHYAEDLGFQYMTASNKQDFIEQLPFFLQPNLTLNSIIFEIFTDGEIESEALKIISELKGDRDTVIKNKVKKITKSIIGDKIIATIKNITK